MVEKCIPLLKAIRDSEPGLKMTQTHTVVKGDKAKVYFKDEYGRCLVLETEAEAVGPHEPQYLSK